MQAPTNGFFYVLDRTDGSLISAQKLGKVTWADAIDLHTGRPVERTGIRYEHGPSTFRTEEEISDLLAYIRQISRQAATAQR